MHSIDGWSTLGLFSEKANRATKRGSVDALISGRVLDEMSYYIIDRIFWLREI